jgi:uncharacterized membrane protein
MAQLLLAALVFFAFHFIGATPLRPALVGRFGENAYRAGFSVLSILALIWLARAYANAPFGHLYWSLGAAGKWAASALMLVAVFFLVSGLSVANPAAAGGEKALERENAAQGILRITRHPVLWGIALWGVAHLLANGDTGAIILFGSLTALALYGTLVIDQRRSRDYSAAWEKFAAVTSGLPFLAIIEGRNRLSLREIGWLRPLAALVLYGALYLAHPYLFGVSPQP